MISDRPVYVDDDDPAFAPPLVMSERGLLDALEGEIHRSKTLLDRAYEDAVSTSSEPKDTQRYINASQTWSRLVDQCAKERERIERIERDRELSAAWQKEADDLASELTDRYERFGPHYTVLCQALAPLVIKLRKSYAGGIRLTPSEQTDLTRTVMAMIGQLQKHTESTKTEAAMTHDLAVRILSIVEVHVAPQPQLWQRIVKSVRKELEAPVAS